MASLGQELKRERELRAISLKEISNLTKISVRYLQALEDDKLDLLPGTFFIKGVLRAYSKCIGVDEHYFVNKYHEEVIMQEDAEEKERKRKEEIPFEPEKKKSRFRRVLALSLGIFLAVLAAAYFFIIKSHKDNRSVFRQPAVSAPKEQQIAPPTLPLKVEVTESAQEAELRLELTFLAETWIQVLVDGQMQVDGTKQAGEKASFAAKKEFIIHTGNAGGIAYTINGRTGTSLGGPGIVRTDVRINRDNLADFLK
jgi:cytoskeletal protein RodZ